MIDAREAMDIISKFLYLANNIRETCDYLNEQESLVNAETQDYLHALRFSKFNACEGYRLAKGLQEVQQRRGKIKDNFNILKYARYYIEDNPDVIDKVRTLANQMNQQKKFQKERTYHPRVHHELNYGDTIALP